MKNRTFTFECLFFSQKWSDEKNSKMIVMLVNISLYIQQKKILYRQIFKNVSNPIIFMKNRTITFKCSFFRSP